MSVCLFMLSVQTVEITNSINHWSAWVTCGKTSHHCSRKLGSTYRQTWPCAHSDSFSDVSLTDTLRLSHPQPRSCFPTALHCCRLFLNVMSVLVQFTVSITVVSFYTIQSNSWDFYLVSFQSKIQEFQSSSQSNNLSSFS